jgi:hypothetical protein
MIELIGEKAEKLDCSGYRRVCGNEDKFAFSVKILATVLSERYNTII